MFLIKQNRKIRQIHANCQLNLKQGRFHTEHLLRSFWQNDFHSHVVNNLVIIHVVN